MSAAPPKPPGRTRWAQRSWYSGIEPRPLADRAGPGEEQLEDPSPSMCFISFAAGTSRPRRARIVRIYGEELGRKYDIEGRDLTIGSDTTCGICVREDAVSPTHATITADDTGVKILAHEPTTGTYVNDQRIHEASLKDGDLIRVGRSIFKILSGNDLESSYHEETYRLSTIDGLTQVFKKRYFTDTLEREVSRARRYERPLALCMLDLDGFARFNYAHGHPAGDHVLRRVAEIVRDASRKVDIVARYGGDELAVILPEVELPNATAFAEVIRVLVEQTRFTFEDQPASITISVGVAALDPHIATANDLIQVATTRLARAKDSGRNRVVASDGNDAPAP